MPKEKLTETEKRIRSNAQSVKYPSKNTAGPTESTSTPQPTSESPSALSGNAPDASGPGMTQEQAIQSLRANLGLDLLERKIEEIQAALRIQLTQPQPTPQAGGLTGIVGDIAKAVAAVASNLGGGGGSENKLVEAFLQSAIRQQQLATDYMYKQVYGAPPASHVNVQRP